MKVIRPKENKTLMVEKRENIYLKEKTMAKIKEKGITLIALVVTIIVLLILAGISISMLSGDNSILSRVGDAKEEAVKGEEIECIRLSYYSAKINKTSEGNTGNVTGYELEQEIKKYKSDAEAEDLDELIIVSFENGHKYSIDEAGKIEFYGLNLNQSKIISARVYSSDKYIIVLFKSGKLTREYAEEIPNSQYVQYSEEREQVISENVKEYYDGNYYITKNNELYIFENNDSKLVGENVKKYFSNYYKSGYFLDQDDTLFHYNGTQTEKIAENVKDILRYGTTYTGYLTTDNKFYDQNNTLILENIVEIKNSVSGSNDYNLRFLCSDGTIYSYSHNYLLYNGYDGKKIFDTGYYIDTDNKLYKTKGSYSNINDNNKGNLIDENVEDVYYSYMYLTTILYIKNGNSLYQYNDYLKTSTLISNDVKKIISPYQFINNDDSLYEINNENAVLISENVKKIYSNGDYLTNDSILHTWDKTYNNVKEYDEKNNKVTTKNGIIDTELDMNVLNCGPGWYEDENGKIFYYVFGNSTEDIGR